MLTAARPSPGKMALALLSLFVLATLVTGCLGGADATPTPVYQFGDFVTSKSLGANNTPSATTSTFSRNDTIYAVVKINRFPQGHKVFSRWTIPGEANEDTGEITADRDYSNTYLEFHTTRTSGQWPSGQYTVQLFIDGNAGPTVQFTVQ